MTWYLEDLTPGMRFVSASWEVTADDIRRFAREYDPQPFHLDELAARGSVFGGLAASGWHVAAMAMKQMVQGPARFAGGMIGAGCDVNWVSPTRPGDILQVESEVLEVRLSRSRPDRGIVTLYSQTLNQEGELRMTQTARLMVFRRPA